MGTITENIKNNKIFQMINEAISGFSNMINSVDDSEMTVEEAIKETEKTQELNEKEINRLKKFDEIADLTDKDLAQKAEVIFDVSNTFGNTLESENIKKVEKVKVSEEKALEDLKDVKNREDNIEDKKEKIKL